jgi:hypothetical protein
MEEWMIYRGKLYGKLKITVPQEWGTGLITIL